MKYVCSMSKKKEALTRKLDGSLGTIAEYSILSATRNGAVVFKKLVDEADTYGTADELYNALDDITGASTRGKLRLVRENNESGIEGYLDLEFKDKRIKWSFRVWILLEFTDPTATAIVDLGL